METIVLFIFKCFYLVLPAYFANMAPVIFRNVFPKLGTPIDLGVKIKGRRLFGKNKTYRGFVFGVLTSILIALCQRLLFLYGIITDSFVDFSNWLLLGFLLGFGAMLGDLIESFVKRRIGIKPGRKFIPWDELDFMVGAMILSYFIFHYTVYMIMVILLLTFILHITTNHTAYYLKIRKEKW